MDESKHLEENAEQVDITTPFYKWHAPFEIHELADQLARSGETNQAVIAHLLASIKDFHNPDLYRACFLLTQLGHFKLAGMGLDMLLIKYPDHETGTILRFILCLVMEEHERASEILAKREKLGLTEFGLQELWDANADLQSRQHENGQIHMDFTGIGSLKELKKHLLDMWRE